MPLKARIDNPGELHHIIVCGIERKEIFSDDAGREYLLTHLVIYSLIFTPFVSAGR
jgi:hypothetical protein